MKQNLRNAVIAASIACTALTVQAQTSKGRTAQIVSNSLMKQSTLPFNAPDFSRIKENDYLPAIRAAIAEQRAEIKKITDNKQKPTFVNTDSCLRTEWEEPGTCIKYLLCTGIC